MVAFLRRYQLRSLQNKVSSGNPRPFHLLLACKFVSICNFGNQLNVCQLDAISLVCHKIRRSRFTDVFPILHSSTDLNWPNCLGQGNGRRHNVTNCFIKIVTWCSNVVILNDPIIANKRPYPWNFDTHIIPWCCYPLFCSCCIIGFRFHLCKMSI